MKKTIALTAMTLASVAASAADTSSSALSVSTTFGWESKYIFRGAQLAEEIFTPSLDLSLNGAYLGVWGAFPVDNTASNVNDVGYWNELDVYAGYGWELGPLLSADVGVTHYSYPSVQKGFWGDPNTNEAYMGLAAKTLLSPSVYVYYDMDLQNFTVEGSIGHSIPIVTSTSLDLGAYTGFVSIGKNENYINPVADDPATTTVDESKPGADNYWYYGVTADLVYSFNANASFSFGARWGGSSEKMIHTLKDDLTGKMDNTTFWYGFKVTAGF